MTSSFSQSPPGSSSSSKSFGSYRVAMELGADALATTYLACRTTPQGHSQQVRLSVMHAELAESEAHVQRFLDEARLAAAVSQESVGQVLDAGRADGRPYAAYEYAGGRTFAEVLAAMRGQPSLSHRVPAVACFVLAKTCLGLHVVHQGLAASGLEGTALPTGLSPHSLLVTYDGGVRIAGFGGRTWGTPGAPPGVSLLEADYPYRAPERILGHEADRRADLWSMGVMLFEAVTGLQPFLRTTRLAIDRAIVSDALPTLRITDFVLLGEVVDSCLKRRASDRFEDATQLADALQQYLKHTQDAALDGELSQIMQGLFGDLADRERSWLRSMSIAEASAYLYSQHGRGQDIAAGGAAMTAAADGAPTVEPSTADLWSRPAPSASTVPQPVDDTASGEVAVPRRRALWPVLALLGTLGVFGALLGSLAPPSEPALAPGAEPPIVATPLRESTSALTPPAEAPSAVAPRAEPIVEELNATPEPTPPADPGEFAAPVADPPEEATPEPEPTAKPDTHTKKRKNERVDKPAVPVAPIAAPKEPVAKEPVAKPAAKEPVVKRGRGKEARGEPGTVVIGASDGWAEIYFDGARLGATPLRTDLPSGNLTLEVRPFGTGTPRNLPVVVKAGEVTKVRVPL